MKLQSISWIKFTINLLIVFVNLWRFSSEMITHQYGNFEHYALMWLLIVLFTEDAAKNYLNIQKQNLLDQRRIILHKLAILKQKQLCEDAQSRKQTGTPEG